MPRSFYVYILASKRNGTLYTGSTDDIGSRIYQHKTKALKGFTAQYGVNRLVWMEAHPSRQSTFARERRIKEWKRAWKVELIEKENPEWLDSYETING